MIYLRGVSAHVVKYALGAPLAGSGNSGRLHSGKDGRPDEEVTPMVGLSLGSNQQGVVPITWLD
jgi:hypothetical protein